MEFELAKLISTQYLMIVPFIYVIGMMLKTTSFVKNQNIPFILTIIGAILGISIGVFEVKEVSMATKVLNGLFQGVFCAGLSVYGNQIYKCFNNSKDNDKNE